MPYKDKEKQREANKRYEAKRTEQRTRSFATVVYPESAPEDWMDRLSDEHIPALISPLHDQDVNPDGTLKKPHYHVLLMFETMKNYETQVKPIFKEIGGVGREMVTSARGYARYLCHLDNPEKHQYDESGIRQMAGADYRAISHRPADDGPMLAEIFNYIRTNRIFSFAEFLDVVQINNMDWFNFVAVEHHAYVVEKYIRSLQWEYEKGYTRKEIESDPGEESSDK